MKKYYGGTNKSLIMLGPINIKLNIFLNCLLFYAVLIIEKQRKH